MPLSIQLDSNLFRTPLEGDHPCGINLQGDEKARALRSSLRDLREEARRIERHADDGDASEGGWPAAVVIWRQLRDKSLEVLTKQSRDTSVAALCIEALSRTDGFAGLAAGFDMTRAMIEGTWDHLYPIPDPEDGPAEPATILEERIMPIVRLVGLDSEGLIIPAIQHIPLTADRSGDTLGLCHWKSSLDLAHENDAEKIQLAVSRGAVSPAQFSQAVQSTSLDFLKATYLEIKAAEQSWEALCQSVYDASAGAGVVPASPIRALFEECETAIRTFAPQAIPVDPKAESSQPGATGSTEATGADGSQATPGGREEAFRQLESIAGFFDRHDPHSLIAAQIRNVVRLGRLSRADYFRELIADESALKSMFKFVGIEAPPPGSS